MRKAKLVCDDDHRHALSREGLNGSTTVSDLLAWLDEQEEQGDRRSDLHRHRAEALAMIARFAEAILTELRAQLADQGSVIPLAQATGFSSVDVEMLAGDPAPAAGFAEEGCRLFEEAGERSWLSTAVGKLALALYELDRLDEADAVAGRSAELGASDDALTQMLWRQARAKVLARRGDTVEAERLAREAVAIGAGTEMPDDQAKARSDLAEVLTLAGRTDEAEAALREALALFELKGNLAMAERTSTRLRELGDLGRSTQAG
jgi:tetratricopeptide (TPR) repeat protein